MKKTRFLIADDHAVVRNGLRMALTSNSEYTIVAEANDGEEAVRLAQEHRPDVIVMDVSMPRLNGIEATAAIKKKNPDVNIIILTVHEDEEYISQILRAGASGYLSKSAGKKEIFAAIKSAMSGERFFSPGISNIIIESFTKQVHSEPVHEQPSMQKEGLLTKREAEVLQYIASGHSNRQIADILFLSVRTVNTHRSNLMQKLDIHETASLVRYAIETGLLEPKVQSSSFSAVGCFS